VFEHTLCNANAQIQLFQMKVGDKALEALRQVHGTNYKGGATPELLYPASGGRF